MDSESLELSLGTEKQSYIPGSITHFLNHLSNIRDVSQRLAELNEYVSKLEQEMSKLNALNRNPQHCMLLIKDAVEFLKNEGEKMKRDMESKRSKWPAIEEAFMPLKRNFKEREQRTVAMVRDGREEENWVVNSHSEKREKPTIPVPKPSKLSMGGGGGGAFTPFKATTQKRKFVMEVSEEPILSLLPPGTHSSRPQLGNTYLLPEGNITTYNGAHTQRLEEGYSYLAPKTDDMGIVDGHYLRFNPQPLQQQQHTIWKNNRRCWSPELHARFVAAMDFLGGPEVATPKQIRAVMKVEGLTNDQVKSHLQKYRLHNKRQLEQDAEPAKQEATFPEWAIADNLGTQGVSPTSPNVYLDGNASTAACENESQST